MFGRRARHCLQCDHLRQTVECLPDPGGRSFQRSTRSCGQDGASTTTRSPTRSRPPSASSARGCPTTPRCSPTSTHTRARRGRGRFGAGDRAIPEIDFAAIATGGVGATALAAVRRRGVVVVRNVFPAEQAAAWNDELGDYVTRNGFYEQRDDPELDHFFSNLKSRKPQIFGIYWSRPQVQARQSPALTATRTFLTGLWTSSGPTGAYFDSQRQCTYADRIRRREPGDTTLGLSAHMDAGSVERWRRSHHPRSEVGRSAFSRPGSRDARPSRPIRESVSDGSGTRQIHKDVGWARMPHSRPSAWPWARNRSRSPGRSGH